MTGDQTCALPICVAPVHRGEHAVVARLQREVQLLAHLGSLGHRCDGLRPQVLGVRARVAHPPDALHGSDVAEQLGEERSDLGVAAGLAGREGEVAPLAVHVLTEEGALCDAVRCGAAPPWTHFVASAAGLPAPPPPPGRYTAA